MNISSLSVAAIRSTVIDTINKAKSGHPGMSIDAAPIIYTLFSRHIVADPSDPEWVNRDRFVLSAGHCSALLYTMLHLCGYGLSMDDLKGFRQLGTKTPGHPEFGFTKGVDASGGPLGQGIAQAVGMAIAETAIAAQYKDGEKLMNHYTYCLCGDGCLEEGLSQEAISLAGHYKLSKLILIYDENGSTLDGPTTNSLTENVRARFEASGWRTLEVEDGNDVEAIDKAIDKAKAPGDKPTMILVHTIIGYGSKLQGSSETHGKPLGKEDGDYAKKSYGYEYPEFTIPAEVYDHMKQCFIERGQAAHEEYKKAFDAYRESNPEDAKRFLDAFNRNVEDYMPEVPEVEEGSKFATRNISGDFIDRLYHAMPFSFGGSADVAASVMTNVKGEKDYGVDNRAGRDVNWGIREFAMACACNGILLHGGLLTYCGSFLVFADYMKAAIRMSALQKLPNIYLFSHDSIAVGEDGPTHQPIDQLAMLRSIPGVYTYRCADARETYFAWKQAMLRKDGPTAIILSRQALPTLEASKRAELDRGAYIALPMEEADIQIIASGSEVGLALDTSALLLEKGIKAEVVSLPCWEAFEAQDAAYKNGILRLPYEKRFTLEMLSTLGWAKYGATNIGIDTFGSSAPAADVIKHFGFTKEVVAEKILNALN